MLLHWSYSTDKQTISFKHFRSGRTRTIYLIDYNRIVYVGDQEILEGDVLDDTASNACASPRFDSRAVLRVSHLNVSI